MKRSFALLGLFLPVVEGSAPLSQHSVKAAKRIVQYENSEIPHFPLNYYEQEESKTPPISNIGFMMENDETLFWFVHADAVHEHPDHVMKHILKHITVDDDILVEKGTTVSLRRRLLSLPSIMLQAFANKATTERKEVLYRVTLEDVSNSGTEYKNASQSIGSINETFYQVSSTSNVTSNSTTSTRIRRFRPLRIRSYLSDVEGGGQYLSSYERSILLQSIIKPAMLAWSAALRVHPVLGNLTVDSHQLVDGLLCGPGGNLPSITVPTEHLTFGVPNTDYILYVNLAFAGNQTNISAATDLENFGNSTTGNDSNTSDVKSTNFSYSIDITSNSSDPAATTVSKNEKPQCHGDYLAASAFCSTDQFDRPTAAILHLCIDLDFFNPKNLQRNIRLVSHELGHALGFNIVSLAHFRRPDGSPYTQRDPVTNEIPISEINCTGPVGQLETGMIALPSSEVLQFRIVRGGVRVAEVVTPSVRQVARNYFDCQDLPGAELESGEFLPLSRYPGEVACLGDHWERRLFKTDLMNPLLDDSVDFTTRFSTITLAYFADSGWYQVDLSRASLSAGWGRAAGCDFIEQTCVKADDGQVPSNFNPYFCNQISSDSGEDGVLSEIHGCTTDLTRKASCSLDQYDGELPSSYQYFNFSYGSNIGGADPFMDYCPVYSGFTNGLCSESDNEALIKVNFIERFGQRNSRCLAGHVSRSVTAPEDALNSSDSGSSTPSSSTFLESTALCLPIACVVEDRTLRIQVNGVWKICSHKDELIVPLSSTSFITRREAQPATEVASVACPDPIRVCPTFFCQRDCLGTNRICDYNVGKCVCESNRNATSSGDYISGNETSFINGNVSWNETSFINGNVSTDNTSINQTDVGICIVSNASTANADSFYEPRTSEDDSELPNSDSPLSDYYYKTERYLEQESSSQFWTRLSKSTISSAAVLALLIVIVFSSCVVYHRRQIVEFDDGNDQDGDGMSLTSVEAINPNKDKLMASVVVSLRMRDPALQGVYREDPLANRDSETDLSMTNTEGTSEFPGSVVFSLESFPPSQNYSGTIVDISAYDNADLAPVAGSRPGLYDDVDFIYIDPLAPQTAGPRKPVVRRRRQMFSGQFN
jgi:Leishmanolysin